VSLYSAVTLLQHKDLMIAGGSKSVIIPGLVVEAINKVSTIKSHQSVHPLQEQTLLLATTTVRSTFTVVMVA